MPAWHIPSLCLVKAFTNWLAPLMQWRNNYFIMNWRSVICYLSVGQITSVQLTYHHFLDGHFFTLICFKIVLMFVWKRPKKRKRGRDGPFLKKVGSCKLPSIFCFFTTYPTRASISWFRNRKKIIYSSISEIETKPIVTQKQILALAEPINAVQLYFPWMIQTKHCS